MINDKEMDTCLLVSFGVHAILELQGLNVAQKRDVFINSFGYLCFKEAMRCMDSFKHKLLVNNNEKSHVQYKCSPFIELCLGSMGMHWHSSHYAVTHVYNKNSNIQVRSPYVVNVIFHTIRNCSLKNYSYRKNLLPLGANSFL